MRWVIIGAAVLLVAFLALMLLGGDDSQTMSQSEQIDIVQDMPGKGLLGAITAPFAPEVAIQRRLFEIPAGETLKITVLPQKEDLVSLRLSLTHGLAAVATFVC